MASEERELYSATAAGGSDAPPSPLRQQHAPMLQDEVKYVLYVRLPFKRGDFVDPPPADWDESKSEALWSIISGVAKAEIDWHQLAADFCVTVPYILQMAAYLTERHTSELRAQMAKAAVTRGSNAPSPVPGAEPAMPGAGSIGSAAGLAIGGRAPSALSVRRDSMPLRNEGSVPGTPVKTSLRPQGARNPSTKPTVMTQQDPKTVRVGDTNRRRLSSLPITSTSTSPAPPSPTTPVKGPSNDQRENEPLSPGPAESSPADSSSPSSSSSPVESRIIRRPPRFHAQDAGGAEYGTGDDEEPEPVFLAFNPKPQTSAGSSHKSQDLGATLRGAPSSAFAHRIHPSKTEKGKDPLTSQSQTSDSSNSSAAPLSQRSAGGELKRPGPLSPRRTAELVGRSPGGKGKGYSREGSDGAPSMGSSFSDLEDASVTQSALEEALASKMHDNTFGSRMSMFGQQLRSRYLPNDSKRQ